MSFADLKKSRQASIDKLVQAAESITEKTNYNAGEERFWRPTRDKAGNGYAVIRFLPAAGDDLPWTRYWDHGFQGPTGLWYIENSLTTLGQDDPVSELNSQLWNSGIDSDKEVARKQKRRLHYVSNVYVVSDPSNPQNEGKVFLYKYGKKIFDKLMESMQPQFDDEQPVNPFDLWEGADFKIKIRNVEGWVNYDKSEFASPSALLGGDDEKLEELYSKVHSLKEFTDPSNYKSYGELKAKMNKVLGITTSAPVAEARQESVEYAPASVASTPDPKPASSSADDDDDTLSYFEKLARDS
jgi:hypothetical protein